MYISEKALCGFLNWFHGMEMFQLCHLYATKGYQHILPNFLYQNPSKFQQVPVVSREATSDRKVLILFFFFQFLHFRSLFILSPLPTGIWYSGKMCALNIAVNRGTMREVTWSGEMTGGGERSQPPPSTFYCFSAQKGPFQGCFSSTSSSRPHNPSEYHCTHLHRTCR